VDLGYTFDYLNYFFQFTIPLTYLIINTLLIIIALDLITKRKRRK
jgi:hypothetical protein